MYHKDVKGHGFFRKKKWAKGLACGVTLMGVTVFSNVALADEIVTETTPAVEVVNPNPATNLETVQEAPSAESLATQAETGQKTGELTSPVTSTELDKAVSDAKEAGVTVTEDSKPVVYDNLDQAQADLAKQAEAVKDATVKQEDNTEAIKKAEDHNAEIDRKNKEEAARIARENAEIDARNKVAQEKVDKINSERKTQVIENEKARQEAMDYNKAEVERVEREYKEALAEWEKTKATTGVNDPEYIKAKAEYDKAKAEYDLKFANYLKEKAAVDAHNAQEQADYEAKKAEMEAKINEDGYLSRVEIQELTLISEPNAKLTITGDGRFANKDVVINLQSYDNDWVKALYAVHSDDYYNSAKISQAEAWIVDGSKNGRMSEGYAMVAKEGDTIIATYENLENVSVGNVKIVKAVYQYDIKQTSDDQGYINLVIYKDPTVTIDNDSLNDIKSKDVRITFTPKYFDDKGNQVDLSQYNSLLSIASLNYDYYAGQVESVQNLKGVEFIPITGSTIQNNNGVISATSNNSWTTPQPFYNGVSKWGASEWDVSDGPNEYYGAGVLKVTAKDFSFDLVSSTYSEENDVIISWKGYWQAITSNVKAPLLPPPPSIDKKDIPEPEKPTPPEPKPDDTPKPEPGTPNTKEVPPLEKFIPVTVTPEPPKKPNFLPHIPVPEKETYEAAVHPVIVKQTPANIKAVVNEDGVDVNGKLVPKGSTQTWVLTNSPLVAGREVVISYTMLDPLPAGFEIDREATAIKNTAWTINYDENGKTTLSATQATLDYLNANRNQDVVVPVATFVGRPINDGGTYKNTFTTLIATPKGEYKVVSNIPVIYTPGNDPETPRPPHTPGGENPTPDDNLIQPKKDVVDDKGNSINGQSVLPNTILNYVAEQDFDQYKGIVASQNAIGKGFLYVDDYLDEAIDGTSLVVNSITAANGDDVRELFDMIHVLSKDSLDEKLQALIKDSGISPVGEFYLWVAKDPEAFYKAYVQQGLDITRNLSFKIKQDFVGTITNQTYQVDFGNGYYGNIVTNEVPQLVVHKDVLDKDGKSINNGTVQIGDLVTYKLEGWVIPAGRGYDIKEYRFVDLLQHSHDDYQSFVIEAKVDFTLPDGTIIKKGDDLSSYTETVYNAQTGKFETRFKEAFLAQIPRDQAFGADGYITVKRVASGEVVNEYTLYVNGNPVISNKVVTNTPEPPKPETPKPQAPAKVEKAQLPNTGDAASYSLSVAGVVTLFASLVGLRKRKENE
ncbi:GbpC/Spa domain-containing protein [Streptococcus suis]|uniref:SspB-related isopeptide-forming adhesin n=2 Tax=Streptococcus suis TaxID=1307 RepID=UPI0038B90097